MSEWTSNPAIEVFNETLESATEEGSKILGGKVLGFCLSVAIATPTANVFAALAKAVVGQLLKSTSSIEKQIDKMLAEPFQTAKNTVETVLSVSTGNQVEQSECQRRLNTASDSLDKAYTYAQSVNSRRIVRYYQALVAALQQGGRPFVEKYIGEFQVLAANARQQAKSATDSATYQELLASDATDPDPFGALGYKQMQHKIAERLRSEGRELETFSKNLENYCEYLLKLSQIGLDDLQTGDVK